MKSASSCKTRGLHKMFLSADVPGDVLDLFWDTKPFISVLTGDIQNMSDIFKNACVVNMR